MFVAGLEDEVVGAVEAENTDVGADLGADATVLARFVSLVLFNVGPEGDEGRACLIISDDGDGDDNNVESTESSEESC